MMRTGVAADLLPATPASGRAQDPAAERAAAEARARTWMLSDYNGAQLGKKAQYIASLDPASGQPLRGDAAPAPRWVGPDTYEVKAAFLDQESRRRAPGAASGP